MPVMSFPIVPSIQQLQQVSELGCWWKGNEISGRRNGWDMRHGVHAGPQQHKALSSWFTAWWGSLGTNTAEARDCICFFPCPEIFPSHVLPCLQDSEVRKAFQRSLEKQGIKFKLGTKVRTGDASATHLPPGSDCLVRP